MLVDLAADVNAHIVVAHLGSAPATTAESFRSVAEVGAVPVELAERLVPAAGLRNLLVHRYGDIDLALLGRAIGEMADAFDDYVGHLARWLSNDRPRETMEALLPSANRPGPEARPVLRWHLAVLALAIRN